MCDHTAIKDITLVSWGDTVNQYAAWQQVYRTHARERQQQQKQQQQQLQTSVAFQPYVLCLRITRYCCCHPLIVQSPHGKLLNRFNVARVVRFLCNSAFLHFTFGPALFLLLAFCYVCYVN